MVAIVTTEELSEPLRICILPGTYSCYVYSKIACSCPSHVLSVGPSEGYDLLAEST
jgi:hypothetical protein